MAICGPNNIGFVNVHDSVALWTLPSARFRPGSTALITQSGTAAMVLAGDPRGLGLAYVITCGDEAVLTAADYLDHVVRDDRVQLVVLFLEAIRDPVAFSAAATLAADRGKKILALKVGRSDVGVRAVAAHTGALAGDDDVYDAFFRRHGIVRVADLDEMVQTAALFEAYPSPPRNRTAVPITMSGGVGALVADTAADAGVALPALSARTRDGIRAADPALNPQNPLDAWGLGYVEERFSAVLDALIAEDDIGVIAPVLSVPASGTAETWTARSAAGLLAERRLRSPAEFVLINSNGLGATDEQTLAVLDAARIPCLHGLPEALRAIGHWLGWRGPEMPGPEVDQAIARALRARDALVGTTLASRQTPTLAELGIPMAPTRAVRDADDAVTVAEQLGYPVVLKGIHPALPHKTEHGLVRLGLVDAAQVRAAFADASTTLRDTPGNPGDAEIVLQPTAAPGVDVVVAIRNDTPFGSLIIVGLGGIYVEVLREVSIRVGPVSHATAREMLEETRAAEVLRGARGRPAADVDALVDAVVALSHIGAASTDAIRALEINPLVVHECGRGVTGLDVLLETQPGVGVDASARSDLDGTPA
jgi:acyl-CoA synthetase (NDP forming)